MPTDDRYTTPTRSEVEQLRRIAAAARTVVEGYRTDAFMPPLLNALEARLAGTIQPDEVLNALEARLAGEPVPDPVPEAPTTADLEQRAVDAIVALFVRTVGDTFAEALRKQTLRSEPAPQDAADGPS